MDHSIPLIETVVGGLVLAFLFGAVAHRVGLPTIVGYLAAGVAVGPFTPGFVADQDLASELAEIGVILLMFGVGLHFSLRDLMAVRRIAAPGAVVQIAVSMVLGWGLGRLLGWGDAAGLLFGLALSVASTVVLLRALQERRLIDTDRGRIAVGWLIVEDLVMVLALVMIPALAGRGDGSPLWSALLLTVVKVGAFAALMLVAGRKLIPALLHQIAHTGSRELFRLAVLALALGVAFGSAALFDVSFALGAFFAGMILAESPFSQRAAEETLPLRDAFAVLFFVSVGMLFNPDVLVEEPFALLGTLAIILIGKSVAAFMIVRLFGRDNRTALTISASLAQIGEFSFILATLGGNLGVLPPEARDLILAGAILSIMLNPLLFRLIDRVGGKLIHEPTEHAIGGHPPPQQSGHVVLVGHGRVGGRVADKLCQVGVRLVVIESEDDVAPCPENARLVLGNAASGKTLEKADLKSARLLFVAIPETYEAGQAVEQARRINPSLRIVARSHSPEESAYLMARGADLTIVPEAEVAQRMIDEALLGARE